MATREETLERTLSPYPSLLRSRVEWLDAIRESAWETYQRMPMPDSAAHLWRYTDQADFVLPDPGSVVPGTAGVEVVMDGEARAAGVTAVRLANAARAIPDRVRKDLGRLIPAGFGKPEALNTALWTAGYFVRIPRGVRIAHPLRIVTTLTDDTAFRAVRNLIVVEEGASATIVEEARGAHGGASASLNEVTEAYAGPDSRVRLVALQNLGRGVVSHRTLRARLANGARLETVIASFGARLYKADIGALLEGPGAESRMTGFCFADGRQRADHHTVHDHVGGRTRSDIDFRVVLAGRARSAYTGLIRIARDAPHCEAYQENRNLLLSDGGRAESIPELEILNDEVRCKHGATVGPIDQDQLFYLGSRGLTPVQATRIVVSGFLEETLRDLPEDLQDSIRNEMTERLEEVEQDA